MYNFNRKIISKILNTPKKYIKSAKQFTNFIVEKEKNLSQIKTGGKDDISFEKFDRLGELIL